jgi:hypothetical protein
LRLPPQNSLDAITAHPPCLKGVGRYVAPRDTADQQDPSATIELKKAHLKEQLTKPKSETAKLDAIEKQLLAAPDHSADVTLLFEPLPTLLLALMFSMLGSRVRHTWR